MKKFLLMLLFFANFLNSLAKEIIEYKENKLNISRKVYLLEDKVKSIKEEDIVRGLYDDKFKLNKDKRIYLLNNDAIYYIKLDIKNLSSKGKLDLYGWFGHVTLNRTDISYIYIKDGKLIKKKFTRKIDENDKEDLLNYGCVSFDILPNEIKTIYIRLRSSIESPLILTEKEKIIKEERFYFLITNIFVGISLIVLLTIFGFYLRLRKNYLLYYLLIFTFTYLKSNLFLKFLRNYVSIDTSFKVYTISVIFYIFFLISFVIDILKLNRGIDNIKITSYLTFVRYVAAFVGFAYLLNILSFSEFIKLRGHIYLATFTLILYAAVKRSRNNWLYKAFLFSWLPQWILYVYLNADQQFKLKIVPFDIRVSEYLEIFVNLLSIAAILMYNAKELWKGTNTVEEQEEFIKIINGTDNLMHGLLTLIHAYKRHINYDRVMYFRRKVDRENDNVLYYDFSVPLTLKERDEEKEYFDLSRHLRKDTFKEYYVCDDIQSNELYKTLLPKYKSFIALRLNFVEGGDLGYIVILNDNKVEYEYNEIMKDFRYKASLLVQYFKTIDDIRDKYGSIIVEETLRNFHIEVLRDAERDVTNTLGQLEKIRTLSSRYVVANDPNVKRVLNLFYDNLEDLMINIRKDLTFDNPDKRTKKKIKFNYNIIEEMLNYLEDIVRKSNNKINIRIINKIDSDYELFGHIKIIRSIMDHYLSYMYNKIIKHNIESNITVTTSLDEGKLRIDTKIEGLVISVDDLKKDYNNEVHKALLNSTRSKLEITADADETSLHIIYLLNLLTSEEKKKFNIPYINYDEELEEIEEPIM